MKAFYQLLKRLALPCAMCLAALMLNLIYEYESVDSFQVRSPGMQTMTSAPGDQHLDHYRLPDVWLGGWPFKYFVQLKGPDRWSPAVFSWTALLGNCLFFASLLALHLLYEGWMIRRAKSAQPDSDQPPQRRAGILDILVLMIIVGAAAAYYRSIAAHGAAQEEKIIRVAQSGPGHFFTFTTLIPKCVKDYIPGSIYPNFRRLQIAILQNPDEESVRQVMQCGALQSLRIGGGKYDLRLLDGLPKLSLLSHLRVSGRELDPQALIAISGCKRLEVVSLMRTNITSEGVTALGDLPFLDFLCLAHTDVRLSELGRPPLAENIRHIVLPHPEEGSDSALIEGWPNLEEFHCWEYDAFQNSEPVSIELKNLPKLKAVTLDAFQVFDLTIDGIHSLEQLQYSFYQANDRVPQRTQPVSCLSIRNLLVKNTPKLPAITMLATTAESIRFDCPCETALHLLPIEKVYDGNARGPLGDIPIYHSPQNYAKTAKSRRQGWLDSIGSGQGPTEVDLSGLPLGDLDFTRFAANQGIRRLNTAWTDVPFSEALQFGRMKNIESLRLGGLTIEGKNIERLAVSLPKLKSLCVEAQTIDVLRLEKHAELQTIFAPAAAGTQPTAKLDRRRTPALGLPEREGITAIKLVDVPKLADTLSFDQRLYHLHIENAPALTGLIMRYPLPRAFHFSGLRDLHTFFGGGERLNDEIAEAVLQGKNLKHLAMVYSSVSPMVLKKINQCPQLETLHLSGSHVTDEVVEAWTDLKSIQRLALEDTQLTAAGLSRVLTLGNFQQLSLDGRNLTAEHFAILARHRDLEQLTLLNATLDADTVKALLALTGLESLNLSGSTIDAATGSQLAAGLPSLQVLTLRDGKIPGSVIRALSNRPAELVFDLTDTDVDADIVDLLVQRGRATVDRGPGRSSGQDLLPRYSMEDNHPVFIYWAEEDARRVFAPAKDQSLPIGPTDRAPRVSKPQAADTGKAWNLFDALIPKARSTETDKEPNDGESDKSEPPSDRKE